MKKNLCIACLIVALIVNAGSANAQSGRNTFIRQILIEIGSEAARELSRIMLAPRPTRPEARRVTFTDSEWLVAINGDGNDLSYYGVNLTTRDSLTLRGATVSTNSQRQVYTWNNGNYRYQVAWRPSDPQVIRLQVFNGRRELLNRLLYDTSQ